MGGASQEGVGSWIELKTKNQDLESTHGINQSSISIAGANIWLHGGPLDVRGF